MTEGQGAALEFTMRKHLLLALAEWALPVVPASAQLPVNRCFRLQLAPDRLQLGGAGGQLNVLTEAAAVLTRSAGTVFLPARTFTDALAQAPDGDVHVRVAGNEAVVTAGSTRWTLRTPLPDGYAGLPDLSGAQFSPAGRVKTLAALKAVRHAVGTDAGRPAYTQAAVMELDGQLCACACDSVRFARVPVDFPFPLQVPGAMLPGLVKLLSKSADETVDVADHGPCTVFRAGPVTLAAVKAPDSLPDVSRFLAAAAGNDLELTVDRAELAAALKRVRVSASASTSAVALIADPDDGLILATRGDLVSGHYDSAEAPVAAKWEGDRQILVVNGAFLADMLAAYPAAECTFLVGKARGAQLAPLVLRDPETGALAACQQLVHRTLGY